MWRLCFSVQHQKHFGGDKMTNKESHKVGTVVL